MTDFAKYNAKDLNSFHVYQPLKPFTEAELTALYEIWTKQERERIIKLLETETLVISPANPQPNHDWLVFEGIREQFIALIKGEQK